MKKIFLSITVLFSLFLFQVTKANLEDQLGAKQDVIDESMIIELQAEQLQKIVEENQYLLIQYHTQWCQPCQQFKTVYASAAQQLIDESQAEGSSLPFIRFAKIDASKKANKELGRDVHNVKNMPAMYFYQNGEFELYTGGLEQGQIVEWLKKKVYNIPFYTEIESCQELRETSNKYKFSLIYFGEVNDGSDHFEYFNAFKAICEDEQYDLNTELGLLHGPNECAQEYGLESMPGLVYTRHFNKEPAVISIDGLTKPQLIDWMTHASRDTVLDFNQDAIDVIFAESKDAVVLFTNDQDTENLQNQFKQVYTLPKNHYSQVFKQVAKQLSNKDLYFVRCGTQTEIHQKLSIFLGINTEDTPALVIINPSIEAQGKIMPKYKYQGDLSNIDEEAVKQFVKDYYDGKLVSYKRSAQIPEATNDHTVHLVGSNFDEIVRDPNKDAIVFFHAPNCNYCVSYFSQWEELAKTYAQLTDNLIIGELDAMPNEVEDLLNVRKFPYFRFYAKENSQGVEYKGEWEIEDVAEWLEKNSTAVQEARSQTRVNEDL